MIVREPNSSAARLMCALTLAAPILVGCALPDFEKVGAVQQGTFDGTTVVRDGRADAGKGTATLAGVWTFTVPIADSYGKTGGNAYHGTVTVRLSTKGATSEQANCAGTTVSVAGEFVPCDASYLVETDDWQLSLGNGTATVVLRGACWKLPAPANHVRMEYLRLTGTGTTSSMSGTGFHCDTTSIIGDGRWTGQR